MKIFADYKAQKAFSNLYSQFTNQKQLENFVKEIRILADKKVTSEEGEYKEFYVTQKDVERIYENIINITV